LSNKWLNKFDERIQIFFPLEAVVRTFFQGHAMFGPQKEKLFFSSTSKKLLEEERKDSVTSSQRFFLFVYARHKLRHFSTICLSTDEKKP
jgi:hypothetical protein